MKPITRAELLDMYRQAQEEERERKITQSVTTLQNQTLERARGGNTFLDTSLRTITNGDEVVERLRNLLIDCDLQQDRLNERLRISWGPPAETRTPAEVAQARAFAKILRTATASACYRCGRAGHWISDCQASTDSHGNPLRD